ncbi:MAG TPA: LemA family protein [Microvirga sp.]|jgi:LemA protein
MIAMTLPARLRLALTALVVSLGLSACGLNTVPALEERAVSAWNEVQTQHRRRADLVATMLDALKGLNQQEREVLAQVAEARARAAQVPADAAITTDPQRFKAFQDAQNQLSTALGRLLVTVERYPELKSSAGFLAVQSQLEDVENRIAVGRRDYSDSARAYNTALNAIPGRWVAGFLHPGAKPMETFATNPGSE